MRAWALYKKEMRVYFTSPIAYAVFAVFTIVVGFFFFAVFNYYQLISQQAAMNPMAARDLSVTEGVLRPLFQNISVIMLFMLPIVTMRLFAEEKRSGSIELLLTYPIRDGEVLLGKYLAALSVMIGMLALTLAYPAMVASAAQLEWGTLLTGYLGLILQGAAFIAIGIMISSLTENQIVAALATFGTLLMFWVVSWAAESAPMGLRQVLSHLSITEHFETFAKGVIDTKDLIYYLNLTIVSLFLTLRSLESKRWRG
jgi:ABC-2 type transport system permease protein